MRKRHTYSAYSKIALNRKALFTIFLSFIFMVGVTFTWSLFNSLYTPTTVYANPTGGAVVDGTATITQVPGNTQINQTTEKAIIHWDSFNINPGETTHFQNTGGMTLNRISPNQGASEIYGHLTATGQIILVNPAGVYFGPNAYVHVAGIIASTADITNNDFNHNNFIFHEDFDYNGTVINDGTIVAERHGLVALMAGGGVANNGLIKANMGHAVLASGGAYTLSFDHAGLFSFAVTQDSPQQGKDHNGNTMRDAVSNTGRIVANGGRVILTARAVSKVLDNAINMKGVVEAKTVMKHGGEIILLGNDAGTVRVSGKMNASGKRYGQKGGSIKVTGQNIVTSDALLDVSGSFGGGTILLGGNYHGQGPLPNAANVLALSTTTLLADALIQGNGGQVIVWSDHDTQFYGTISAKGGTLSGNGGFIETSGHTLNIAGSTVSTYAPQGQFGTWLLDPADVTIGSGANTNQTFSGGTYTPNSGASTANVSTDTATTLATNLNAGNVIIDTINSGSSGVGIGNITINNQISWTANTTLTLNAQGNIIFAGATNPLINASGATSGVVLNANLSGGANTIQFTGNGGITAGSITLNGNLVLNTAGLLTSPGNININGTVSGNGNTLTINTGGTTSTITGAISGTNTALTKSGAGTLTLSGNNTYTGATAINSGILIVSAGSNLGTGTITVSNGSTLQNNGNTLTNTLNLNGSGAAGTNGALIGTGAAGWSTGAITLVTNSTIGTNSSNDTFSVDSIISSSGNRSLTSNGPGTLVLSGNNTYSGATIVANGILEGKTSDNAFGSGNITVNNGASLRLNGITPSSGLTLNGSGASGSSGALIALGSAGWTTGNITLATDSIIATTTSSDTLTISSSIRGNGLALTINGDGTIYLSGNNRFNGGTIINSGIVQGSSSNNAFGSGAITVNSGATIIVNNISPTRDLTINSTGASGTAGPLIAIGAAGWSNATITLGSDTTIATTNSTDTFAISSVIDGVGQALTITGPGTITLSKANTYTGGTIINSGILSVQSSNSVLGTGAVTVMNGATLRVNNRDLTNAITLNGTGAAGSNGALVFIGTGGSWSSNNITLGSNTKIGTEASNDALVINSVITDSGSGYSIAIGGPGTVTLTGNNSFSGGLSVDAGTLRAQTSSSAFGTGSVLVTSGGTVNVNNVALSNPLTINGTGVSGTGALTATGANAAWSTNNITLGSDSMIGTTTATTAFNLSSNITDNNAGYSLTTAGTGSITLSGTNAYSGGTVIGAGTLIAQTSTSALGNGAVTVNSGATLTNNNLTLANNLTINGTGATGANGALTALGASASWNTGTITLGSNSTIGTDSGASAFNISSMITGSFAITTGGNGSMVFSGNNNYSGGTTITNGNTITAQTSNTALGSGTVTINNGATLINDNLALTNNITVNGTGDNANGALVGNGTASWTTGTITLGSDSNIGTNSSTSTFSISSPITGAFNITTDGSGTLIFAGNNSYNNTTVANNTTLIAQSSTSSLGLGSITVANGGTLQNDNLALTNSITIIGNGNGLNGSLIGTGNASWSTGTITLSGNSRIATNNTSDVFTINSTITDGGSGFNLTSNGPGTITLAGANNWSGTTTLSAGTIQANNANAFGTTSGITVSSGASLIVNNVTVNNTISSLQGSGTTGSNGALVGNGASATWSGNITLGANATIGTNSSSQLTISGTIDGTAARTLTTAGSGIILFTGNNTYLGPTNISSGTLKMGSASAYSSSSLLTLSGGTLVLNGFDVTASGITGTSGTVDLGSNSLTVNDSGNHTYSGILVGNTASTFNVNGNAILTIDSANTSFSGTTTLNNGTLQIGSATDALGSGNIIFNGGNLRSGLAASLNNNYSINDGITATLSGTNDLALNGSGQLGANSILRVTNTGTTTLNTLSTSISSSAGNGTLNSNATAGTVSLNGNIGTSSNPFASISLDKAVNFSGIQVFTGGSQAYTQNVNLTGNTVLNIASGNISFSGSVSGPSNTLTMNGGSLGDHIFTLFNTALTSVSVNGNSSVSNTFFLEPTNTTLSWNITGTNSGSFSTSYTSGTFNTIQTLRGGNTTNTFNLSNGGSIESLIPGSASNYLSYENFNGSININLSSANSGTSTNLTSFNNIGNLIANNNANFNNTLHLANQTNTLTINGATNGSVSNGTTFNGFSTYVSTSGNDRVFFNTNVLFLSHSNTAIVNGRTLYFVNFNNNNFLIPTSNAEIRAATNQSMNQAMDFSSAYDFTNGINLSLPLVGAMLSGDAFLNGLAVSIVVNDEEALHANTPRPDQRAHTTSTTPTPLSEAANALAIDKTPNDNAFNSKPNLHHPISHTPLSNLLSKL